VGGGIVRRQLVTADPAAVQAHDHTSWRGHGPRELHRVAARAFTVALERNERLLLVAEAPRADWLEGLADVEGLIERGTLTLTSVDEAYAAADEPGVQRAQFERMTAQAIADGYAGLCVVADNSRLAAGDDEEFAAWLAWESTADEMQATGPVTGICYFDLDRVPAPRLKALAAMHLVRSEGFPAPPFQLYFDAGALRVHGELDSFGLDEVRRVVAAALSVAPHELDISGVTFINHRALIALDQMARAGVPVRLRGATPLARRIWQMINLPAAALEFSA
jgi:hypothetical protein